jgi:hypothetical protein
VRSTRTLTLSQAVAEPGRFRVCSFVFSSFESSSSLVAELEGQDHSAANVEGSIGAAIPFSPNPNNDHPHPEHKYKSKDAQPGPVATMFSGMAKGCCRATLPPWFCSERW